MKKQWKDLVSLYNFLAVMLNESANKVDELVKQIEASKPDTPIEQIQQVNNELQKEEEKETAITALIKAIEPHINSFNRLKNAIIRKNAITIKGGELKKDERGGYCYTVNGENKRDAELDELAYLETEIKPLVENDNILLAIRDFKILKQYT